jgi:hypothetical protein
MPFADPDSRDDLERRLVSHSWARGKCFDLFERLACRVLTRRRGATFEPTRNVHLHVMEARASGLVPCFGQR